jgi:hypothetical protein
VGSSGDVASLDDSQAITWLVVVEQVMMESLERMRCVLVDKLFLL